MVVHIYGFACLFFMLAFYAFFSGMNIRQDMEYLTATFDNYECFCFTVQIANTLLCSLGDIQTALTFTARQGYQLHWL